MADITNLWETREKISKRRDEQKRRDARAETAARARRHLEELQVKALLLDAELSDEQKEEFTALYPEWAPGNRLFKGDMVEYNQVIYEVVQPHTTQDDWRPDTLPALYKVVYQTEATDENGDEIEVVPEWKEPQGTHDAYQIGDRVHFAGKVYESVIAGNTWDPLEYPPGWLLIRDHEPEEGDEPDEVVPEWVEPQGGHDAYSMGARVSFEGKVYESLIHSNIWSPTAYPQGWQLIGEEGGLG